MKESEVYRWKNVVSKKGQNEKKAHKLRSVLVPIVKAEYWAVCQLRNPEARTSELVPRQSTRQYLHSRELILALKKKNKPKK